MNILFFSQNYENYSAYYQHDLNVAMAKHHNVFFYGPGYEGYDVQDDFTSVMSKCTLDHIDLVCFGTSWERDDHPTEYDIHPKLEFSNATIPKALFLNKEYKKLDRKFEYIKRNRIDIVFTVHHDYKIWEEKLNVRFVKLPFAIDPNLFRDYGERKIYDLGFSGAFHEKHSDIRRRIFDRLMAREHRRLRLYLSAWHSGFEDSFRERAKRQFIRILRPGFTLSTKPVFGVDYAKLINRCRIYLATTSTFDIVGTRFYEVMACRSLLFCNQTNVYEGLFEEGVHCVSFESNLSDFSEKLYYYLTHDDERERITSQAYQHVHTHHTWDRRIEDFTRSVRNFL